MGIEAGATAVWSNPEEARLLTILNSMVEAVFVTDDKGRVTLTNRALEELVGNKVHGLRAKKIFKSDVLRDAMRRARRKGKATEVEIEVQINEQRHVLQAQVAPLPDAAGVVTVLHDVTRLKDTDRMRRDFVANASHELRTPLTAIMGFAETLQNGALHDLKTAERFMDAILRHTHRLQRLVEDLAVLSRAESPDYDWQPGEVDVTSVCWDAASSLDSLARKKSMKVRLEVPDEPAVATVNEFALEHVLINLIENAIKYSARGDEVVVAVHQTTGTLQIAVQDSGPGIPPKYLNRIFERFYRVDKGRSRSVGGTGLGLSIVKHLVDRMHGRIEVDSEVGKGTVFTLHLPTERHAVDPVAT